MGDISIEAKATSEGDDDAKRVQKRSFQRLHILEQRRYDRKNIENLLTFSNDYPKFKAALVKI